MDSVFEHSVFEPRLYFYFSTNSIKFPVVKHFNFFPQEKEKELSKKLDELQKEFRYSSNCLISPSHAPTIRSRMAVGNSDMIVIDIDIKEKNVDRRRRDRRHFSVIFIFFVILTLKGLERYILTTNGHSG